MSQADSYYVRRRGKTDGPWPLTKLRAEIALRKLGRHDEVSSDGASWRRAGEIQGLFMQEVARKTAIAGSAGTAATATASSPAASAPANSNTGEYRLRPEAEQVASGRAGSSSRSRGAASDSEPRWYICADEDRQIGPIPLQQLLDIVAAGRATLDSLVWREGFADWVPIDEVPEILNALDAPAPYDSPGDVAATRMAAVDRVPTTSTKAVAAFALGLLSLALSCVPLLGLVGVVAAVVGILANRDIVRAEGRLGGAGIATGGILAGSVGALIGLLWTGYLAFVVFATAADA